MPAKHSRTGWVPSPIFKSRHCVFQNRPLKPENRPPPDHLVGTNEETRREKNFLPRRRSTRSKGRCRGGRGRRKSSGAGSVRPRQRSEAAQFAKVRRFGQVAPALRLPDGRLQKRQRQENAKRSPGRPRLIPHASWCCDRLAGCRRVERSPLH
jgi:hypothetical protein